MVRFGDSKATRCVKTIHFIRKHLRVAGCGLEDARNVTEHSHSTSSRSSAGHRYTPVVCGFHYLPHIPNKKVYAHIPNKKDFDC